jgi:hypothetical protein
VALALAVAMLLPPMLVCGVLRLLFQLARRATLRCMERPTTAPLSLVRDIFSVR